VVIWIEILKAGLSWVDLGTFFVRCVQGLESLLADHGRAGLGSRHNGLSGEPGELATLSLSGMSNKSVGYPNVTYGTGSARLGNKLSHAAACTTRNSIFFECDETVMTLRRREY
jgi:hypothetical protein